MEVDPAATRYHHCKNKCTDLSELMRLTLSEKSRENAILESVVTNQLSRTTGRRQASKAQEMTEYMSDSQLTTACTIPLATAMWAV